LLPAVLERAGKKNGKRAPPWVVAVAETHKGRCFFFGFWAGGRGRGPSDLRFGQGAQQKQTKTPTYSAFS
jgi:hypothetical protein